MAYINGNEILFSANIVGEGGSGENRIAKLVNGSITEVIETDFGNAYSCRSYAFYCCYNLVSVAFPNSISQIGDNAFYNCESLKTVKLSSSLNYINMNAFFYCKSIETITLPSTVTSIGQSAFYGCESLKTVRVEATTPPRLATTNVFEGCQLERIIVPTGCVDAYKTATNWSEYADLIVEE